MAEKQGAVARDLNIQGQEELELTKKRTAAIESLADRLKMYLSVTYVFQMMKRAIRGVWNDLKDFDAQFTEIAVVTNKTTKELWGYF